jgi:glutathione S-transferase
MKLYYSPGACSLAPHIVMRELGHTPELVKVDLGAKKTEAGDDFMVVNAKGYVPTVELKDGSVLTEVSTILQYLVDQDGKSSLLPKFGGMPRYRAMETLNFVSAELHKSIGGLFNKAMPEDGKKTIVERINKRLDYVNALLGKHKYMSGEEFGAADAYAFTVINWCNMVGIDLSKWKNVSDFMGRVAQRPAVQSALKAEGLA